MQKDQTVKIELKQTFPLTIKRLGINGEGVGYFKRQVVFVPGALPGEEVVVETTKVHPKFAEAKIKNIRKKSEFRVQPICPVYEECGGCQLQHLEYNQQLKEKRDIIIQSLERHTKLSIEQMDIRETIGMENPWNYRNKSQFQVGQKDGKVLAGLYGINSHQLVNIDQCAVQHSKTNKAIGTVKKFFKSYKSLFTMKNQKKGLFERLWQEWGFKQVNCKLS